MSKLAQGEFNAKVTGDYKGDFLSIKKSVNETIDSLSGYITEMSQVLEAISCGDLTQSISHEYMGNFAKIKHSINHISSDLHKTMLEISSAASQVSAGAKEISSSAMSLADGSAVQASSVEELTVSMEHIKQQTRHNAANAKGANDLAGSAALNAQKGNEAMLQMLEAMQKIKASSNNISSIIKDIQDIAFQTNLLSLNAAVEAARAGNHGKGFNVVAEEVRSLAVRSQKSATETTNIIEESIAQIEAGASIAQATADSLNTIVYDASEVLSIVNDIANASSEQSKAIEEISVGLKQISDVVQSTSAISEESASASEELSSQAGVLQHLVGYFKL